MTLLWKWKGKSQTGRKDTQIMYLRKDLSLEYINTSFNNYTKNPREGGNGQMMWTDIQIFHQRDTHGKHKYFKRYSTLLVIVKVAQLCPWNSGRNTAVGSLPFSRGSSQPRSPALQADSLPAEPQEKLLGTPKVIAKSMFLPHLGHWCLLTSGSREVAS